MHHILIPGGLDASVAQQLLAARCNIDLKAMNGLTTLLSVRVTPKSPR
jgi:hypothetical protein